VFEQILKDLKNKAFKPVYFLMGDEPWYIDAISDYIEGHIIAEEERDFNLSILYGRETDVSSIIATAKEYPMMAEHRVVIVKEAQYLQGFARNEVQEPLAEYLKQPLGTTLLVFCYKGKKLDKRKTLAKTIAKTGVLFESKKLYDDKIPGWINNRLKVKKYSIIPKGSVLLSEYLGNDLHKIENELEKLFLNIPAGTEITSEHIESYIGISKEYNNFELQNALGKKDVLKANKIAMYFAMNGKQHPLVITISMLYNFYSKILVYHVLKDKTPGSVASALGVDPYFVRDYVTAARNYDAKKTVQIVSHLREYDLRSKGVDNVSTDAGELLKELVYKILH